MLLDICVCYLKFHHQFKFHADYGRIWFTNLRFHTITKLKEISFSITMHEKTKVKISKVYYLIFVKFLCSFKTVNYILILKISYAFRYEYL